MLFLFPGAVPLPQVLKLAWVQILAFLIPTWVLLEWFKARIGLDWPEFASARSVSACTLRWFVCSKGKVTDAHGSCQIKTCGIIGYELPPTRKLAWFKHRMWLKSNIASLLPDFLPAFLRSSENMGPSKLPEMPSGTNPRTIPKCLIPRSEQKSGLLLPSLA